MHLTDRRIVVISLGLGALCAAVFAGAILFYGEQLRDEIRQKVIERDAAVLYPVAQQQVDLAASLSALLPDAKRHGTLALAIFDAAGATLDHVPASQPLVELPLEDYVRLQDGQPLTRYHPQFSLAQLQPAARAQTSPVLEIVLPLSRRAAGVAPTPLGFVRYYLDARPLAAELAKLDANLRRKTLLTLALGLALIGLLSLAAQFALLRARRAMVQRNDQLARTHSELALASKASALGQIASHLLHDLRGPVSGLQAVVQSGDTTAAALYAQRLDALIREASDLLADHNARATYELDAAALGDLVRRRHEATARQLGVNFTVHAAFPGAIDSHRGSLLCLIASNLVQNALAATPAGRTVAVEISSRSPALQLTVTDAGSGIPAELLPQLFTPGRSGRPGGTGLGLAISQLLARQIGATLELVSTGPTGTVFRVTLPLAAA